MGFAKGNSVRKSLFIGMETLTLTNCEDQLKKMLRENGCKS
jgi:hypothetical protein